MNPSDKTANPAVQRQAPAPPARGSSSLAGRFIRPGRSMWIRIGAVALLIAAALVTNRSFLGWGLFAIFAILIVPLGRARSFVISFIPYSMVWFVFTALRSLADETVLARTLNLKVAALERRLFGGDLPTILLQDRLFDPGHLHWYDYFCTGIHWSYFVIPHAVAIRVWHKHPELWRRYLGGMTLLLGVGLAMYFLIPTNPPWLAPEPIDSPSAQPVYRIMNDVAGKLGGGLYNAGYKVIGESNPRAAMPSIHMAITFLIVFPAFRWGRRWGYLALLYSALMGYSLMYLGEHYFVDVMAGVAVTTYGWYAAGAWIDRVLPIARRFFPGSVTQAMPGGSPGAAGRRAESG